jgi:hypothetical protein
MNDHSKATQAQQTPTSKPKVEANAQAQSYAGELAPLLDIGMSLGSASPDEVMLKRLSDARLAAAQRQRLAAHIGMQQGNRQISRLIQRAAVGAASPTQIIQREDTPNPADYSPPPPPLAAATANQAQAQKILTE